MLVRLEIENVALVEKAELEFDRGLSVLTGETGAGKSVVLTALALTLGARGEKEYIRHGADQCRVVAHFDLTDLPTDQAPNAPNLSEFSDQARLNISRELSRTGSTRIRINGRSATLTQLRSITEPLAQILGQHAGQMLLDESNHLGFLDNFARLQSDRETVAELYRSWRSAAEKLARLRTRREQLMQERELLLFQREEIGKAEVRPGEEARLLSERKVLDSARSLMTSSSLVENLLGGEEQSAAQFLSLAQTEVDKMATADDSLAPRLEQLVNLVHEVEDLRSYIEQYGGSLRDDPVRIEEINLRLDELYNLKKKYGGSEEAILSTLQVINQKLADRPDVDTAIADLESETGKLCAGYSTVALKLSKARKKAGKRLARSIVKELTELAIENGGFEFEFVHENDPEGIIINGRAVKPFEHGLETVRMLFSANPGEPLKSLVKTASGGEISRVFLAIKAAETSENQQGPSLLVFDEVDDGIGGQTAVAVGDKLKKLAADRQVLVVTHLHQIGRKADHHYAVKKSSKDGRATITIKRLNESQKPRELDRMLALPKK